ncbi:MAG: phosphate acetyltransferase [Hyphomicrobiales bacterium]|nr:phosphate acetyltransferase [Hyphomicrobiales bacterium]MCP5373748.1 phosphate acetyltransferase [Hyphomicrobiales bacterium]
MKDFDALMARARADRKHIVLAEGEDPRVVEGARLAVADGIADVTLLGRPDVVRSLAAGPLAARVVDPAAAPDLARHAAGFHDLRRHKGVTAEQALETVRDPLYFANMMVRAGDADGSVAGARYTSSDTVRAAIQVVGIGAGHEIVSSFFIMLLCEDFHRFRGAFIFSDCGLVIDPNARELAEIALTSADTARDLLGLEPRVAMLSFSTKGSARHALADKVIEATDIARARRPGLKIDGELQLDAAVVPEINAQKAPGSPIEGRANVFIFPDLQAGNIAYKITERLGLAKAIGPILQGLDKPANDLSRGCSAEDVCRAIAVTAVQAQARAKQS